MCNIEFPHFGASYPDAHCIDGYLYDVDMLEIVNNTISLIYWRNIDNFYNFIKIWIQ